MKTVIWKINGLSRSGVGLVTMEYRAYFCSSVSQNQVRAEGLRDLGSSSHTHRGRGRDCVRFHFHFSFSYQNQSMQSIRKNPEMATGLVSNNTALI